MLTNLPRVSLPNLFRARHFDRAHPAGTDAEVRVTPTGLSVTTGSGEEHWPWRVLRQRSGAFDGGAQLEHATQGELLVFGDLAILAAMRAAAPAPLAGATGATVRRHAHPVLVLGVIAVALVMGAWLAIPHVAGALARGLPLEWEEQFGDAAVESMVPAARRVTDPRVTQPVESIVARLAAAQESPFRFRVVVAADSQVNAFAAPGGRMVVNTGLVRFADNADELAGVIAHEMEHVRRRHVTVSLFQRLSLQVLLAIMVGEAGGVLGGGAEVASRLGSLSFSRDAEREADAGGAALLRAAGIEPRAMLTFLERMRTRESSSMPELLSTHPAPGARVEELRRRLASSPATAPNTTLAPALSPEVWIQLREAVLAAH